MYTYEKLPLQMASNLVGLLISECDEEVEDGEAKVQVLLGFQQSVASHGLYACVAPAIDASMLALQSELGAVTAPGGVAEAYILRLTLEPQQADGLGVDGTQACSSATTRE